MKEIQTTEAYIPGVCNIGPGEVNKRLRIGYIGLVMMITFIIVAEVYHFPPMWKLGLFAPSVYALSGFIQARHTFCFLFGFFGLSSTTGKRSRIVDATQLRKDRAMALRIVCQVLVGSFIISFLYYFLT